MRAQFIEPMLATLVDRPPDGDEWIHEIKHDGYRSQLAIENGKVQAFTRRGADWTSKYRPVVAAAGELPVKSAIIDGEMTVLNADGRSDYRAFRKAIKGNPGRLVFIAFDLLMIDGKDIRGETTLERRERLQILLDDHSARHSVFGSGERQRQGLLRGGRRYGIGGHRLEASESRLYRRAHSGVAEDQELPGLRARGRRRAGRSAASRPWR